MQSHLSEGGAIMIYLSYMNPIHQVKDQIVLVCQQYGCKKVALFGSYAKKLQNDDSDIDILVEPPQKFGLIKFSSMKLDLQKVLNKKVDLITYKGISPYIRDSILESAQTLYEE